LRICDTQI